MKTLVKARCMHCVTKKLKSNAKLHREILIAIQFDRHQSMKKTISILFIFLVYNLMVFGQKTITGRITDAQTDEPLIGVNIFLKSDYSIGTQTDLNGFFKLNIAKNTDTILISYIGFEEAFVPVGNPKKQLKIKLKAVSLEVATVTVKAAKAIAREFAASNINKLDIYLNPNAKADPLLAVDALPASTGVEETANISLRGSSPAETGMFLNNVPLNDAVRLDQSNGVGQFSIFNTAIIENLQVYASNPPVEFGNATSGVVALNTESKTISDMNSVVATIVGGGLFIGREISPSSSITAYGNYSSHRGLVGLNKKALNDIRKLTSADAGIYYVKQFSDRTLMKFFNYSLLEQYQFDLRLPTVQMPFDQEKKRNQSVINLIHKLPKGQLDWNQGINFSKGNYTLANIVTNVKDFDYFSSLNWQGYTKDFNFKAGASWMLFYQKINGAYPEFSQAIGPEFPAINYRQQEQLNVPELFGYAKWNINKNWILGTGGRYHPRLYDKPDYLNFQTNLFYKINHQQQLIISAGKYHKFLLPSRYLTTSTLLASRQVTVDYSFKKKHWLATAAIYAKDNKADALPDKSILGAELFLRYTGGPFQSSISMTTVQSTLKNGTLKYPSPHDLGYYFRAQIKYDIAGWFEINAIYKHRQGRYYLPLIGRSFHPGTATYIPTYAAIDEGERYGDFRLLDISLSRMFAFGDGILIGFLNVNNLLDFKNVRFLEYNFDYSEIRNNYFSRRVIFFGAVYQWE